MNLEKALEEASKAREDSVAERDRLDALIVDLEAEIRGLTLAVARHKGGGGVVEIDETPPADWSKMARTDAVVDALTEGGRPMGPKDVTYILHSHGRSDDRDFVAACLAYLKTRERVHSVGYGQWVPGPPPAPNASTPPPAAES